MSKTLGNVVDPYNLINEYGKDAVRYYFAREINIFEDGDLTTERFKEVYNANLANGLGNLVARIMKMAEGSQQSTVNGQRYGKEEFPEKYRKALENFEIQKATDFIWEKIGEADKKIQETTPFKLVKQEGTREEGQKIIKELIFDLYYISEMLSPMMPDTSEKIKLAIKENKMPETLFPRKD
jgi:methionyl-tRNA synthetase